MTDYVKHILYLPSATICINRKYYKNKQTNILVILLLAVGAPKCTWAHTHKHTHTHTHKVYLKTTLDTFLNSKIFPDFQGT